MKKLFYLLGLIITLAVIITACQKTSVTEENGEIALKSTSGPSASGHGILRWGDNIRHFSFHANTMPQGYVKGNGVVTYNGGEENIKFDIDCLSVENNVAIMSGIITFQLKNPEYVGEPFWFKVVDNGEGSNYDPDEITLFYQDAKEDCNYDYSEYPLIEIESGNIQVNP